MRENPAEAERQLAEPLEQLETLEYALLALEMDNAEHLQGLLQVCLHNPRKDKFGLQRACDQL